MMMEATVQYYDKKKIIPGHMIRNTCLVVFICLLMVAYFSFEIRLYYTLF